MVQTYKTKSHFDIPYSSLCPVYFLRYPNPLATHVLSVDVISREIISRPIEGQREGEQPQEQHVLKTSRLILKRGTLPKWAPKGVIRNTESWVLEESEVELDPIKFTPSSRSAYTSNLDAAEKEEDKKKINKRKGREMKSWTRNLDHTTAMAVTELNIFREKCQRQSNDGETMIPEGVGLKSTFNVTSGVSFSILRNRIEKFGLNRVLTHIDSSRQGILTTHTRFLEQRLGLLPGGDTISHTQTIVPTSTVPSKRARLAAALRPPFLDGDFVGPIARMKSRMMGVREWWRGLVRGGVGDESSFRIRSSTQKEIDEQEEGNLTPTERLRKRFLKLRDQSRFAFRQEERGGDEDDDDD